MQTAILATGYFGKGNLVPNNGFIANLQTDIEIDTSDFDQFISKRLMDIETSIIPKG